MMQSKITDKSFSTVRERILGYANEDIDEVEIKFEWDVPHIIESCSNRRLSNNADEEVWSPATHVVILKASATDDGLMATTCEEYLTRNWHDDVSETLLRLLHRFTDILVEPAGARRFRASVFPAFPVIHPAGSLGPTGPFSLGPNAGVVLATETGRAAISPQLRAVGKSMNYLATRVH